MYPENYYCVLNELAAIAISGDAAVSFLQGQLTCDVREVVAGQAHLAAHCTPKGRVLLLGQLLPFAHQLRWLLPSSLAQAALKRLSMYRLRTPVTLALAEQELALGIIGSSVLAVLSAQLGTALPQQPGQTLQQAELTVVNISADKMMIYGASAAIHALISALNAQQLPQLEMDAWRYTTIMAGIPTLSPETQEAFIPQMLNLERLGGVSFTKGCYTGQEIVARTQYLGKLKRRLYVLHSPEALASGALLYSAISDPNQEAGQVLELCADPAGGYVLTAVALTQCAEAQDLRLHSREGQLLQFLLLPYVLSE